MANRASKGLLCIFRFLLIPRMQLFGSLASLGIRHWFLYLPKGIERKQEGRRVTKSNSVGVIIGVYWE